ncbi:MAG: glycosyltransferase [Thermoplasmata archaeon]
MTSSDVLDMERSTSLVLHYDRHLPRSVAIETAAMRKLEVPVVSIVLATLNEIANLPRLIRSIADLPLPDFEIIVVDDGSTDGTREYLLAEASRDPRIRPLFHEGKQTLIPAHCQGIRVSMGEFVIVMDADFQHPPGLLPGLVSSLQRGASLVIASRYAAGGSPGPRTVVREVISRTAEFATKLLLPEARRVSDPTSGFYGFRREIFVPINPTYRGYELLPFLLVMATGRPTQELPYSFGARVGGESKIVNGKLAFISIFLSQILVVRRSRRELLTRRAGPSRAGRPAVAAPKVGGARTEHGLGVPESDASFTHSG